MIDAYLDKLPEERRKVMKTLRALVKRSLPKGYVESFDDGFPSYVIPLAKFAKAGKRLDLGKSCLRFKQLEDVPLPAVADAIAAVPPAKYIANYEKVKRRA